MVRTPLKICNELPSVTFDKSTKTAEFFFLKTFHVLPTILPITSYTHVRIPRKSGHTVEPLYNRYFGSRHF